jgi:hypothetical protein
MKVKIKLKTRRISDFSATRNRNIRFCQGIQSIPYLMDPKRNRT